MRLFASEAIPPSGKKNLEPSRRQGQVIRQSAKETRILRGAPPLTPPLSPGNQCRGRSSSGVGEQLPMTTMADPGSPGNPVANLRDEAAGTGYDCAAQARTIREHGSRILRAYLNLLPARSARNDQAA